MHVELENGRKSQINYTEHFADRNFRNQHFNSCIRFLRIFSTTDLSLIPVTMTDEDPPAEEHLLLPPFTQPIEESFDGISPIKKSEDGQENMEKKSMESPTSFSTAHSQSMVTEETEDPDDICNVSRGIDNIELGFLDEPKKNLETT